MRNNITKSTLLVLIIFTVIFVSWRNPSGQTVTEFTLLNDNPEMKWVGTYRGTLPCANCEGMQTELTLNKNKTYDLIIRYLGKKDDAFVITDKFTISKEGNTITLGGLKEEAQPSQYLIGENSLTQLDMTGKKIEGALAEKYVLVKGKPSIEEKYWKLIQLHGSDVTKEPGDRKEANLMLKAAGNRVTGSGGCNTISGIYTLSGESGVTFTKVISTQMECPTMETEPKFIKVLGVVDQYIIRNDTLMLMKGTNPPSAKLVAIYKK